MYLLIFLLFIILLLIIFLRVLFVINDNFLLFILDFIVLDNFCLILIYGIIMEEKGINNNLYLEFLFMYLVKFIILEFFLNLLFNYFEELRSFLIFIFKIFVICNRVFKLGCDVLVYYLEIVVGFFFNCWVNYLLVCFFFIRIIFIWFIFFFIRMLLFICVKIIK